MPTPRKVAMLAEIKDRMGGPRSAISADYRGLSVAQITELRRALRPANVEVKVVKNTLAAMAAEQAGRPEMAQILEGPTALAIGFGDPIAPVKALTEHLRARRLQLTIHGGWLEGKVLTQREVEAWPRPIEGAAHRRRRWLQPALQPRRPAASEHAQLRRPSRSPGQRAPKPKTRHGRHQHWHSALSTGDTHGNR